MACEAFRPLLGAAALDVGWVCLYSMPGAGVVEGTLRHGWERSNVKSVRGDGGDLGQFRAWGTVEARAGRPRHGGDRRGSRGAVGGGGKNKGETPSPRIGGRQAISTHGRACPELAEGMPVTRAGRGRRRWQVMPEPLAGAICHREVARGERASHQTLQTGYFFIRRLRRFSQISQAGLRPSHGRKEVCFNHELHESHE
jgi:hypothetical protein